MSTKQDIRLKWRRDRRKASTPKSAPDPEPPSREPVPDSSWTKAEIVAWLNAHGDPAQDSLTKAELLEHVRDIVDIP